MMNKPFSQACLNNRAPILAAIEPLLARSQAVLEIGSGTGQHAVYFAAQLPHLIWHTSDLAANHSGIRLWLEEAALVNIRPPFELDVVRSIWPSLLVDAVFSANTAHIMHWDEVEALVRGCGGLLPNGGLLMLYGPFNYDNCYTSPSNARFDQWLKARDPHSGIRNFEDLDRLARWAGMVFRADHAMPANNRLLCWEKGQMGERQAPMPVV